MNNPASAPAKDLKLTDLSPAARAAVEQKTIGGGWDGRSLLKLWNELESWDDMAEARKARAKKMFIVGIFSAVFGFFIAFVVAFIAEIPWLGALILVAGFGMLFLGIRLKKAARAIDLPNEIRTSLKPFFKQLAHDLHPEEKVKVSMNLAGIDEDKCKDKRPIPSQRRGTVTQSTYEEDLCSIRLPLADGSLAILRMENTYLKLERRYSNSRGKSKSKTKWKKLSTVSTILVPPSPMVWQVARSQSVVDRNHERLTFSEKDGVMAARMDRYYKFKAADDPPGDAVPAADIIRMFVKLVALKPQSAGGAK